MFIMERGRVKGMVRVSRLFLLISCAVLVLLGEISSGAVVKLRIRAGNPSSNKVDRVEIRANLPERVGTNEIISLGGLDLGYDIKADSYYVFKEVELGPKETRDYTVELKDIWVIPEDELELLGSRAKDLADLLKGRVEFEEAEGLQKEAADALVRIKEVQDANRIGPGSQVSQHITAYESNMLALERVQEAVGSLENLVLGSGQDPGKLIGSVKDIPPPDRDVELAADQYKTALYRIKVTNPSEKESKKVPLVRELPAEITLDDVIDAGGLDLKSDPRTGVTYVFTNGLELAAGESRTFVVKIRDKWNINFVRIERLRQLGSNIISRISAQERVESIEGAVAAINAELDLIEAEAAPQALNADYVAFFRDQGDRIDLLESKLNRISSALKPINKNQKMGFDAKPPSSKTTWMIIYIILGFLLFMSVVFFFRWWGGSDEVKEDKAGQ